MPTPYKHPSLEFIASKGEDTGAAAATAWICAGCSWSSSTPPIGAVDQVVKHSEQRQGLRHEVLGTASTAPSQAGHAQAGAPLSGDVSPPGSQPRSGLVPERLAGYDLRSTGSHVASASPLSPLMPNLDHLRTRRIQRTVRTVRRVRTKRSRRLTRPRLPDRSVRISRSERSGGANVCDVFPVKTGMAAKILGVPSANLRRWIREGKFDGIPGLSKQETGFQRHHLVTRAWIVAVGKQIGVKPNFNVAVHRDD